MTDLERQRDRDLKAELNARALELLTGITPRQAAALDTDPRLRQYAEEVLGHTERHNLYEVLSVARFLRLCERHELRGDAVRRFFRFYEALRFSGTRGRTRYELTPVQCFIFASIYGLYGADGCRLTRTAYIFVPRKFSKTTSAAAMAVYDLLFGDNNAQAYVGANSYEQARICFDEIRAIVSDIDRLGRHFRVNREKIFFKDGARGSMARCLTANAKTQDGLFASLVILDEYSQARDTAGRSGADLKNVLTTSMGPRKNPLTVIITTASEVVDGPCYRELEGVKAVLRGEAENDSVFGALFMPDVDDREDDPRTWAKVQPHLGVTVREDFYAREWQNAQLSSDNMLAFRTKLLNIFAVNEERAWIPASLAREVSRHLPLESVSGLPPAMAAIDLSESDDFSAVTFGLRDPATRHFHFHTEYFFPEGALAGHANEQLYRTWAAAGHLRLLPGAVIDYPAIVDYILSQRARLNILRIGYDRWKSREVINLLAAGIIALGHDPAAYLKDVGQTFGNFTAPVESFEHGVKCGYITINDNPINAYCFGNAVLCTDAMENCKPMKRSHREKIDGVITTLMCMRLFIDYEQ